MACSIGNLTGSGKRILVDRDTKAITKNVSNTLYTATERCRVLIEGNTYREVKFNINRDAGSDSIHYIFAPQYSSTGNNGFLYFASSARMAEVNKYNLVTIGGTSVVYFSLELEAGEYISCFTTSDNVSVTYSVLAIN